MQTLDDQIIAHLRRLDDTQKRQVLEYVEELTGKPSLKHWLEDAERLRADLTEKYGDRGLPSAQSLLDELREEASEWPRRG
jgi:hypothetical protein